MVFLDKFLFHFSPINDVKAFNSFRLLGGAVGLFLENRGVLLDRDPRWRSVKLNFLPIMLKNAYVGSPLDGGIRIIDLRSS